uniref:Structural polyprotein n=1 Tax=Davidia involucrata TaxID=16924 RepID=A0A5B6ZB93_DAVIN
MASSNSPPLLLFLLFLVSASFHLSLGHGTSSERDRREGAGGRREGGVRLVGRRVLMSFKETPSGGNVTFECSPSGPCIACLYSEKNDEKYRCSETGYRIPFKCVEIRADSKEAGSQKTHKSRSALENTHDKAIPHVMLHDAEELTASIRQRHLLDDSSTLEGGSQTYITYRSCIPAVNEEKLSVLGFEGIILCLLLISGSVIYFRRKRTGAISGVRTPTNSRF